MYKAILFLFTLTSFLLAAEPTGLPADVLAFPADSEDYRGKLDPRSGRYEIWSEQRVLSWALAQGFTATSDSSMSNSSQYRRAAIFYAPGFKFKLRAITNLRGDFSRFGWKLLLDMALLKPAPKSKFLTNRFKNYGNFLRYEVFIDGIKHREIEVGYGLTQPSPLVIAIPFIRDEDARVSVEIRLANAPGNFGILYDARLVRD